jgi:hypothetical protein
VAGSAVFGAPDADGGYARRDASELRRQAATLINHEYQIVLLKELP